jgi:hypothetical protein
VTLLNLLELIHGFYVFWFFLVNCVDWILGLDVAHAL